MEYTWMLNKSFECHEKVLFSCQRHFRKKGKTMIMFLSDKHFDIPFRGSLIWMEWMNCWSDQDGNIHSTRFDFATYTKAVETMALFVEKECACFILNTDVDLKIIRFSLLDIRLEICRDHNDQRSCKICASCVNFSRNSAFSCEICLELQDLHSTSMMKCPKKGHFLIVLATTG